MKKTARLAIESSAFDGRVLLGLDKLGLNPVWQRHEKAGSRAGVWLIGCEPGDDTARHCARCGDAGRIRSSWLRRLAHTPVGQHAVHLMVRVRRYECMPCARSWTDDLTRVAPEGRRLTEAAVWWAAAEVVLKSKSILACARDLHCSWGAVNAAVLEKGMETLVNDPKRLDGVETVGVDEHVWRHTRHGNRYVTVIVDLTPRRHGRPARLLDMVEGRSEKAFAGWLAERSQAFRDHVRTVAMDAFAGYKKAVRREIPHAVEVLDPFHIVRLAGDKLTAVRCRLQRERTGRRGTKDDPLYKGRRVLLKTEALRTGKQRERAARLLDDPANHALRLAHGTYQKIIRCYAQEDRKRGRGMMAELIEALNAKGAAPGCPELATLGRTLKRRMGDVLAFFDREHGANGPTEAINGRLETLRGILPQPRQLHHPQPAAHRRLQTHHPNSPMTTHTYTPKCEEPLTVPLKPETGGKYAGPSPRRVLTACCHRQTRSASTSPSSHARMRRSASMSLNGWLVKQHPTTRACGAAQACP